jgi:hypothetical protein
MPDRPEDLNPIADALARLAPQPPALSRDALLFAAGQAAASPRAPWWVWPGVAAGFAGLSLVLAAFLVTPGSHSVEVRYVTQYVMIPSKAEPAEEKSPAPPPAAAKASSEAPPDDSLRMLRVRRDVFRWGIDMLPRSQSTGPDVSSDMTARDLDRWLNLPPGTFAAPPVRKTGPKPEKDDDDK